MGKNTNVKQGLMKYIGLIIIMYSLSLCSSCDSPKKADKIDLENNVSKLEFIAESNFDSSGHYTGKITSMSIVGDELYLLDQYQNHVLRVQSSDLTLLNIIGEPGDGPKEIKDPWQITVSDGGLYVFNKRPPRLSVYRDQDWQEFIYRTEDFPFSATSSRFIMDQDTLIISNVENGYYYSKFWNNEVVANSAKLTSPYEWAHLFEVGHYIYSISLDSPRITVLDRSSGRIISELDYSSYPTIDHSMKLKKEIELDPNDDATLMILADCYVHKNSVYLLLHDGRRNDVTDVVLELQWQSDHLEFSRYILLPTGQYYDSICADDEYIYAWHGDRSTVQKFKL